MSSFIKWKYEGNNGKKAPKLLSYAYMFSLWKTGIKADRFQDSEESQKRPLRYDIAPINAYNN